MKSQTLRAAQVAFFFEAARFFRNVVGLLAVGLGVGSVLLQLFLRAYAINDAKHVAGNFRFVPAL